MAPTKSARTYKNKKIQHKVDEVKRKIKNQVL